MNTAQAIAQIAIDLQTVTNMLGQIATEHHNLQTGLAGLATQVQNMSNVTRSSSIKNSIPKPEPYNGTGSVSEARHFLAAFKNWASSSGAQMNNPDPANAGGWLRDEIRWIMTALNFMTGDARTWALPALEAIPTYLTGGGAAPFRGLFDDFEKAFRKRFETTDVSTAAKDAIKRLRQGDMSVPAYRARFDEHSSQTGWSIVDLRDRFYSGLSTKVKDTLASTLAPKDTMDELVESATAIDERARQRDQEKKDRSPTGNSSNAHSVPDPNAMDLSASRPAPASNPGADKSFRAFLVLMTGRCQGCGSKDHSMANGNHGREVCNWCNWTGHRANACYWKWAGRPKGERGPQAVHNAVRATSASPSPPATASAPPVASTSDGVAAATSTGMQDSVALMQAQIAALQGQLDAAIKSAF